jgi:hypothetical protein
MSTQGVKIEYDGELVAVDNDESEGGGMAVNAIFTLSTGVSCPVFGTGLAGQTGVEVWTDRDVLVRWNWAPPEIYKGIDEATGARIPYPITYPEMEFAEFSYLADSIRSMVRL